MFLQKRGVWIVFSLLVLLSSFIYAVPNNSLTNGFYVVIKADNVSNPSFFETTYINYTYENGLLFVFGKSGNIELRRSKVYNELFYDDGSPLIQSVTNMTAIGTTYVADVGKYPLFASVSGGTGSYTRSTGYHLEISFDNVDDNYNQSNWWYGQISGVTGVLDAYHSVGTIFSTTANYDTRYTIPSNNNISNVNSMTMEAYYTASQDYASVWLNGLILTKGSYSVSGYGMGSCHPSYAPCGYTDKNIFSYYQSYNGGISNILPTISTQQNYTNTTNTIVNVSSRVNTILGYDFISNCTIYHKLNGGGSYSEKLSYYDNQTGYCYTNISMLDGYYIGQTVQTYVRFVDKNNVDTNTTVDSFKIPNFNLINISVNLSANPVPRYDPLIFSINITNNSGLSYKTYVCKSPLFNGVSCLDDSWCNSTMSSNKFQECAYYTTASEGLNLNASFFVCDSNSVCYNPNVTKLFNVTTSPITKTFSDLTRGIWHNQIRLDASSNVSANSFKVNLDEDDSVDTGLMPLLIFNESRTDIICAYVDIAAALGVPSCIERDFLNRSMFTIPHFIQADNYKIYDVGWGRIRTSFTGTEIVNVQSGDRIMELAVYPLGTSYFNTVNINIAANNLFNYNGDFQYAKNSTSASTYLAVGSNTLTFSYVSGTGKVFYFFNSEPNQRPYLSPLPLLNYTSAYKNSILSCTLGVYNDYEGDLQQDTETRWLKNGSVLSGQTNLTLNINSSSVFRGNIIGCSQRVSDSMGFGNWYNSNNITVSNFFPTATLIISTNLSLSDDIYCNVTNVYDADGDIISTFNFTFFVNYTIPIISSGYTTNTSFMLNHTNTHNLETYTCVVRMNDGINISSVNISTAIGNFPPEQPIFNDFDNTYSYNDRIIISDLFSATDINDDPLQYLVQYYYNSSWYNISFSSTTNLNWNVSLIPNGEYTIRVKAFDGYDFSNATQASKSLKINHLNLQVSQANDNFYNQHLNIMPNETISGNQYISGGTVGSYFGDVNDVVSQSLFYIPDIFDGTRKFISFGITPYQYFENGVLHATGTASNYSIIIYQVSSFGETPSGSPITVQNNVNLIMDIENTFTFNVIPSSNKYIAVKVCLNANPITYACGIRSNSNDDTVFYYSNNAGTYLSKNDRASGSYSIYYDSDVEMSYERESIPSTRIIVKSDFTDAGLIPMVLRIDGSAVNLCANELIADKLGVGTCITSIDGSSYYVGLPASQKGVNISYDLLYGGDVIFSSPGTVQKIVTKPSGLIGKQKINLVGLQSSFSYASDVSLSINSINLWAQTGYFSSIAKTNTVNTLLSSGQNSLRLISSTSGRVMYFFEPLYTSTITTVQSILEPVENGISVLPINFTSDLEYLPSYSFCRIAGNGLNRTSTNIVQINSNLYQCRPYLNFYDSYGTYTWELFLQDASGTVNSNSGTFSYTQLKAYSVSDVDFGDVDYVGDRTSVKSMTLSNTGNSNINNITVTLSDEYFWDERDNNSFKCSDNMIWSDTEDHADSTSTRYHYSVSKNFTMYSGTIAPNTNIERWFKLEVPSTTPSGDYSSEWSVTSQ
ncbi:MAG: hypothetical protein WC781_05445 [Candidatus Pacearchaeota archaeon]|jgi:hypothetical protein